jgi:hypothetical protein
MDNPRTARQWFRFIATILIAETHWLCLAWIMMSTDPKTLTFESGLLFTVIVGSIVPVYSFLLYWNKIDFPPKQ